MYSPTLSLLHVYLALHVYCFWKNFPTYTFIWPYTYIRNPRVSARFVNNCHYSVKQWHTLSLLHKWGFGDFQSNSTVTQACANLTASLLDYSFSFLQASICFFKFTSHHYTNKMSNSDITSALDGVSQIFHSIWTSFFSASRALLWKGSQPLTYKDPISTLRTKDSIMVETLLIWVCSKVEVWIGF